MRPLAMTGVWILRPPPYLLFFGPEGVYGGARWLAIYRYPSEIFVILLRALYIQDLGELAVQT